MLKRPSVYLFCAYEEERSAWAGDSIVATGVAPHISILQHMHSLAKNVNDVVPQIQKVAPEVIRGVIDDFEKRAMTAGTVTRDGLEALISGCIEKSGSID
ncbi:hypothetical protein IV203_024457 [Nitzschia inconspicua]|uniref:Uncharacterized protein n=1 Tax=Nitzschia inconspicua TaxID=303405 RepID=A0A9K3KCS6_9STRA|nr:hypothetical protein IV203_024457 [Nitzschia inconspicua]